MTRQETLLASKAQEPNHMLRVFGGLQHLKGNREPYFSITGEVVNLKRRGDDAIEECGAIHDEILQSFPQFADIVALHLSDIDGIPMHAEANGWYHLAGALPENGGAKYHMGNQQHNAKTDGECLEIFAKHMRVTTMESVRVLGDVIEAAYPKEGCSYDWKAARVWFAEWAKAQEARWKAEADACIAKHGLVVYGDGAKGDLA